MLPRTCLQTQKPADTQVCVFSYRRPQQAAARRSDTRSGATHTAARANRADRPSVSAAASATSTSGTQPSTAQDAGDIVLSYYEAWNRCDIDGVLDLFAEEAMYHDAIYLEPFFGKAALRDFFGKFSATPELKDLKFVITECSHGDPHSCGVAWHTELDGALLPFSRGCSFYRVDDEGLIVWARDVVEAAPPKPADGAIAGLKGLIPVLRGVGVSNSDPALLVDAPLASRAVWAFYAAYVGWILLGTAAPGPPAWATPPSVLTEVLNESLNFFYVNIGLNAVGIDLVPSVAEHPVSEALFNFAGAWGLLFLPCMLLDRRSQKVDNLVAQWAGIMFLTNVFFLPFLAQRAAPDPAGPILPARTRTAASLRSSAASDAQPDITRVNAQVTADAASRRERLATAAWMQAVGGVGLFVGGMSVAWALAARPEYGDLASRWAWAGEQFGGSRVFYAFVVDMGLYGFWQAWMLSDLGAPQRYCAVPFFGQAVWLLQGCPRED